MSDTPPRGQHGLLRGLLAAAAPGMLAILRPFYRTLRCALIIALMLAPMQRWLPLRLGGRFTLAALLTLGVVLPIVVLPVALMAVGPMNELARLYRELQPGAVKPQTWLHPRFDSLPPAWQACSSVCARCWSARTPAGPTGWC